MNRRKQKYIQMRYLIKDLKFYITIPYKSMVPFFNERIWMPKNHPLVKNKENFDSHIQLFKFLKYFDFSVDKNFIDIGANIGDTALVISKANNNSNQVIAVEPSWYFYIYLLLNVRKLKNIYTINKFIKGAILAPKVKLRHWGGDCLFISI